VPGKAPSAHPTRCPALKLQHFLARQQQIGDIDAGNQEQQAYRPLAGNNTAFHCNLDDILP